MSAINLVDADRTFFKSLTGLAFYEPSRCTSICAHAVGMGDAVMVVEDLAQDPRFHDHPFVAKGIRFYAGAIRFRQFPPVSKQLVDICCRGERAC